jgi:hypothetical protein
MNRWAGVNISINLTSAFLICLATVSSAQTALACSVCYGDPNSPMTKGVEAGVLVLLGVVGTVLFGLASLFLFWVRRAANLENHG